MALPPIHPPQEHSCVINIGVGKNLDKLNTLINFLDPMFAEHLREWATPTTSCKRTSALTGRPEKGQGPSPRQQCPVMGPECFVLLSRPWEEGSSRWGWPLDS